MRTVVIGAGFAGIAAARELRAAGTEVVVLEARDRVGGRVHSRALANGAVVELGAEFILPGNDRVRELAASLGLGLWDKGMRYGEREPRGGAPVEPGALATAVAAVADALRAGTAEGEGAAGLLARLEMDPAAREAITARVEISAASAADAVPAAALAGLAHIGAEPAPSIAGGNQGLAQAIAAQLEGSLRLRTPVRRITWGDERVEVGVEGESLRAERCVVAVPASVLGRIELDPPLPARQAEALAAIRYGHAAKLFVPLRRPAPPSAVLSVSERYWTWTATGGGPETQPVVSAFAGSPGALKRLGVDEGPERWLDSLVALRPDLELEPGGAVLSTWDDDPWVGAAYSVPAGPEVTAALAEPVGPLAFAGEHTAGEFAALMEGALRSGERAARALLARAGGARAPTPPRGAKPTL